MKDNIVPSDCITVHAWSIRKGRQMRIAKGGKLNWRNSSSKKDKLRNVNYVYKNAIQKAKSDMWRRLL